VKVEAETTKVEMMMVKESRAVEAEKAESNIWRGAKGYYNNGGSGAEMVHKPEREVRLVR
jgi:hypothetical protein